MAKNGYYDPNKDYSAAIEEAKNSGASQATINQLQQERQNKIDTQYDGKEPNMYNSNQTYTQASSNRGGTSTSSGGTTMSNQQAISNAVQTANRVQQQQQQQQSQSNYQQAQTPTWGSHTDLVKGPGYVTGGYTLGVNGTAILDDNPYWKGTGKTDMSRRPDLAGKTAISNGMTVYYDELGYAYKAVKGVTDYLPNQDFYVEQGTYKGGNLWTDEEMLSAADLQAIAEIRAGIASGKYTGAQANALANQIRAGYGYTIDQNGYVTNSHVATSVNDRRQKYGMSTQPETAEQGYYRYLWNTDTSPTAQQAGAVKSYRDYVAGAPSYDQIGAPVIGSTNNAPVGGDNVQNLPSMGGNSAMDLPMTGGGNVSSDINIGSSGGNYQPGSLGDYLDQWLSSAQQQQINQIDYGTNQAVLELIRQQQEAEAQFQEQRDQIAIDEAKAKDNQALYATARGDKGGIGAAQYDSIMNTAAQNRLQVSQAQQQLATDTARQIADLRAQGEYEKADALLQLSQQYLSQLINLEQWSMEYNLSVAQFNASLQQWQAEYEMAVADLTGYYNGTPTFKNQQYQNELALTQQSQMASAAETLLAAGIMPSSSQLAALGITQTQAQDYITAAQLAAASKGSDGSSVNPNPGGAKWSDVVAWVDKYGEDAAEDYIKEHYKDLGYSSQSAALSGWNNYLLESERQAWVDGMNAEADYHDFKQMAQAISAQLQSGNAASIELAKSNTAKYWNGLTEAERQSLRDLFNKFGYKLNVE